MHIMPLKPVPEFIFEVKYNKEFWWKCSTRKMNLAEVGKMDGKAQSSFQLDWHDGSGPIKIEGR